VTQTELATRTDAEGSDQRRAANTIGAANEFGKTIVQEVTAHIEYALVCKLDQRPAMRY